MRHGHASHRPLRIALAITEIERLPNLRLVGEVKGAYGITGVFAVETLR